MLLEFEKKVATFIEVNELFSSVDRILLAVSGGADSTALLYAMCSLKGENILNAELLCAHINHRLRGAQADLDEQFVIAQAAKLKLTVETKRVDVRGFARRNKLSIETAARELRVQSLIDIAGANDCSAIATAHQKNDNAETLLQRLSRGTALRGLGGIWPMRVFGNGFKFVRPLLCVRRDEIIKYLQERNLKWRQDHTNADCTYRRNYIRHRLLPALQQNCTGSLVEQLSALSEPAHRFYRLVCSCADDIWPKAANRAGQRVTLDLNVLLNQARPVIVELVRRSLTALGCGEKDLAQRHYAKILQLAEQNVSGRRIDLPGGFVALRQYGNLIFARPQKSDIRSRMTEVSNKSFALYPQSSVVLKVPGQTIFDKFLIKATFIERKEFGFEKFEAVKTDFIERFDLSEIKLPLVVRFRQVGDRFVPLGLEQEKKVGKFLTDAKLSLELREKILIVTDSEKIIWVWPVRISEQAKVTGKTQKILQLQITAA